MSIYSVLFINYLNKLRTDNAIKNHFYSTLRRSLRRINKHLGDKNSNNNILKISFLSYLFITVKAQLKLKI